MVKVTYLQRTEMSTIAGKTVEWARNEFQQKFGINARADARVNGAEVPGTHVLVDNEALEFVLPTKEFAAAPAPAAKEGEPVKQHVPIPPHETEPVPHAGTKLDTLEGKHPEQVPVNPVPAQNAPAPRVQTPPIPTSPVVVPQPVPAVPVVPAVHPPITAPTPTPIFIPPVLKPTE